MRPTSIWLLIGIFLLLPVRAKAVSFNVPPGDEVYEVLEELEAVGAISSGIWGIKPLTEVEVARLLSEARAHPSRLSPYLRYRLETLWPRFAKASQEEAFLKPFEDPYLLYIYSSKERPWENFRGRSLGEENYLFGFQSKWFLSEHLLFHSSCEFTSLNGTQDFTRVRLLAGYVKVGWGNWAWEFGVDNIWWGEAYTGDLLFSLNPPPFAWLTKLELEKPVLLPWYFRYLGPFKFSLFASRLERERVVPRPWLIGMKINFKPHPRLEIGLSRSIMCGGEGRQVSLSKILFGSGENVEGGPDPSEGDQKAGVEIRLRPLDHLVLYLEYAGEDEAGGLPSRESYIWGVYAPGLFSRWGVRLEYAYITKWWYHHHVYRSGYTYKGWLMGYYTDRTVRNYFGEVTYDLTPNWRLALSYWREKRYNTQEVFLYKVSRYQMALTGHLVYRRSPILLRFKYRFNSYGEAASLPDDQQVLFSLSLQF